MHTQMLALEPSPAPMGKVDLSVYIQAGAEGELSDKKR